MLQRLAHTLTRPGREAAPATIRQRLAAEKATAELLWLISDSATLPIELTQSLRAAEQLLAAQVHADQLDTLAVAVTAARTHQSAVEHVRTAAVALHAAQVSHRLSQSSAGSVGAVRPDAALETHPRLAVEIVQLAVGRSEASRLRLQTDDLALVLDAHASLSDRSAVSAAAGRLLAPLGADFHGRGDWSRVCAWTPTGTLLDADEVLRFAADPLREVGLWDLTRSARCPAPPQRTYLALRDHKIRPAALQAALHPEAFAAGSAVLARDEVALTGACVAFQAAHKSRSMQAEQILEQLPKPWPEVVRAALSYGADVGFLSAHWR